MTTERNIMHKAGTLCGRFLRGVLPDRQRPDRMWLQAFCCSPVTFGVLDLGRSKAS